MKKLLIILLSLLFVVCAVAFTGCSNKNSGNKDNDSIGNIEHIHNYTPFITPPSCTEKGFTKYTCTCGNNYIDNFVVELGHNFTIYISNNDATYDKDGTKTAICSNANCTATDTIIDTGSKLCDKEMSPFVCSGDTITGLTENGLNKTTLIIPEEIAGVEIKKIADYAFSACLSLTSVTIPNTITTIGDNAFYNCSKLTSITIGNSVTSIGNSAFYNCDSLTSITIPDSVTSIGKKAFFNCNSLTSITIPDSVTSIGESAFAYCDSLTSITIPDSVTSIGRSAFYNCSKLNYNTYDNGLYLGNSENPYIVLVEAKDTSITSCQINNKTKVIGYGAFYGCSKLTSITIPDSVTSIGEDAFYWCDSLTSITIPNSVTNIGNEVYRNCYSLTSVTIGNGVTSIGDWAFEDCDSLTSITIPDSVTSIGRYAFYNCSKLTSVTIGDSVTSIGYGAFYNCSKLTSVNYNGTISQWNNILKGYDWNYSTGKYTVYCTNGKLDKYGNERA